MVVQLIAGIVYELVRNSWVASTVFVKYLLVSYLGILAYKKDLNPENFLDILNKYSRETVAGLVVAGAIFGLTGFSPEPVLPVLSSFTAVFYFGYLFWEY